MVVDARKTLVRGVGTRALTPTVLSMMIGLLVVIAVLLLISYCMMALATTEMTALGLVDGLLVALALLSIELVVSVFLVKSLVVILVVKVDGNFSLMCPLLSLTYTWATGWLLLLWRSVLLLASADGLTCGRNDLLTYCAHMLRRLGEVKLGLVSMVPLNGTMAGMLMTCSLVSVWWVWCRYVL